MRFVSHGAVYMTEELDLEQLDQEIDGENKVQKRIKDLSDKVRIASEERDEQKRLLEESNKKIADLGKDNAFNAGFADILATHSAAKDHKDDIKAKVLAGYSVEDAAFAVLGKAGKLGQPQTVQTPPPPRDNPAGGSAINQPNTGGIKSVNEMTRDEKRAALVEAEQRGDLGVN